MPIAQVKDGVIKEIRDMEMADVPPHKRYLWRTIVDVKPDINPDFQELEGPVVTSDDTTVTRTWTPKPKTVAEIRNVYKKAARERLEAVLKDDRTYFNMIGLGVRLVRMEAAGTITAEDKQILDKIEETQNWVLQTVSKGRELAVAKDPDYGDGTKWPLPPTGVDALVNAL